MTTTVLTDVSPHFREVEGRVQGQDHSDTQHPGRQHILVQSITQDHICQQNLYNPWQQQESICYWITLFLTSTHTHNQYTYELHCKSKGKEEEDQDEEGSLEEELELEEVATGGHD